MFRLTKAVPEIYVNTSRDFQVLCRAMDTLIAYTHDYVDKMKYALDPYLCDERLLPLLATRVGFFYDDYIPSDVLRSILSVYPHVKKYKGTKRAIEAVITAILKCVSEITYVRIGIGTLEDPHTIAVYSDGSVEDIRYIQLVLRNILPSGYLCKFVLDISSANSNLSNISFNDVIIVRRETTSHASKIISNIDEQYVATDASPLPWEKLTEEINSIPDSTVTTHSTRIDHLIRIINKPVSEENRVIYVRSDMKETQSDE